MELPSLISITPIYIAILGLMFIPITMRIGIYRGKTEILIGTGDDPQMLRLMRGQANFVETVPIALVLLVVMELLGASGTWLHTLGLVLVAGRIAHYLGLTDMAPMAFWVTGMLATLITILVSSVWTLINVL